MAYAKRAPDRKHGPSNCSSLAFMIRQHSSLSLSLSFGGSVRLVVNSLARSEAYAKHVARSKTRTKLRSSFPGLPRVYILQSTHLNANWHSFELPVVILPARVIVFARVHLKARTKKTNPQEQQKVKLRANVPKSPGAAAKTCMEEPTGVEAVCHVWSP